MLPADQTASTGRSGTNDRQDGASHDGGNLCRRCNAWRGCLGQEPTSGQHIENIVGIFREVRRVLRKDGTVWLNYGDSYATTPNGRSAADIKRLGTDDRTYRDKPFSTIGGALKPKDLCMIPNRVAIALQEAGWWVRSEIIWAKVNPMPESCADRPTSAHEKVFLLTKSARYFYDADAVKEMAGSFERQRTSGIQPPKVRALQDNGTHGVGGDLSINYEREHRNLRNVWTADEDELAQFLSWKAQQPANATNVWTIATAPFSDAHFSTFPPKLVERCIKAGTSETGCCPECGAPWVREVERKAQPRASEQRKYDCSDPRFRTKRNLGQRYQDQLNANPLKTTGWHPSCECNPDDSPIPCTVLDIFSGAGTTGLVADRLKRDAILIELNPEYAAMARERIQRDAGMFAEIEVSA